MSNWVCSYCGHAQALTSSHGSVDHIHIRVDGAKIGPVGLESRTLVCANPKCAKLTLSAILVKNYFTSGAYYKSDPEKIYYDWQLLPESSAKPQPDFIPAPLLEDYYESCAIRDRSPKASATLSRRCLQGMIRDFCGIAKGTLDAEIKALRDAVEDGSAPRAVTEESVDAIDAVRTVGNIGAHMEKDINLIVDVEPGEAQVLIGLVEALFEEWYVARHRRQQKFAAVRAVADDKRAKIKVLRASTTKALPPPSEVTDSD